MSRENPKISLIDQVSFLREQGRDEELKRMRSSITTSIPGEAAVRQMEEKIWKASEHTSKTILTLSHEPSVGLYRIHEHISNAVPRFAEKKYALKHDIERLKGGVFDAHYSVDTLKSIRHANARFQSMSSILTKINITLESSRSSIAGEKVQ
eukprot:CFRG1042T1